MRVNVQGERWFPSEKVFSEDMPELWGNWYCDSEVGTLRSVLMRRPGQEIEIVNESNFSEFRWKAAMVPERARAQQDALAQIYRDHGIEVHYVEKMREDKPNALYLRDLVVTTPEGAIVCRPAIGARGGKRGTSPNSWPSSVCRSSRRSTVMVFSMVLASCGSIGGPSSSVQGLGPTRQGRSRSKQTAQSRSDRFHSLSDSVWTRSYRRAPEHCG